MIYLFDYDESVKLQIQFSNKKKLSFYKIIYHKTKNNVILFIKL